MTISNSSTSGKAQKNRSRVRIFILVISIVAIVALCLCGWAASSVWRSFQPKTDSVYYPDASITETITMCELKSRYPEPQDWMDVTGGEDRVLVFSYSHSSPFPDSFTAYSLYLQLPPGELLQGEKFDLREDIQSILITTCGYPPDICCTQDIQGGVNREVESESVARVEGKSGEYAVYTRDFQYKSLYGGEGYRVYRKY